MGMSEFYGPCDDQESIATIQRALALGVTLLDTADMYGCGENERLVGRAIKGRRGEVILATKFGNVRDERGNFLGVNGGPNFVPNEAVSFIILTEDQAETDRLWNAIVSNGGQESMCGWCKDRWGFSWQVTPRALLAATQDPDRAAAKRAMNAMMTMRKIDIAAIEAAREGR